MVKLAHRSRKSGHRAREKGWRAREMSPLVQEMGGPSHEPANLAPGMASLVRELLLRNSWSGRSACWQDPWRMRSDTAWLVLCGSLAGCASAAPLPPPRQPRCDTPMQPAATPVPASASVDPGAPATPTFNPAPWVADLDALVVAISSHYANLDYAISARQMDLAALRTRTEARLRAAKSDEQAKRAFRSFLRAFGDGHLSIDWTASEPAAKTAAPAAPTGPLCARLGYEAGDPGGVDFARVTSTFTPIQDGDSADIPGGVLVLPGGHRLGVLRIALFSGEPHPRLCEEARTALGLADDAICDDECANRLADEVSNRLTAALERRAKSLASAHVEAVLVDITGNGGGSDWVDAAVRVVTPVKLEQRATGAVRHEHWVKDLGDRLHDLKSDLAEHGDLPGHPIASAIDVLQAEIDEVKTPCDKSAIWQPGQAKPSCSQLVRVLPVIPYAKPGELAARPTRDLLFGPSRFAYHEGVNVLPLAVLVDGNTASAAEDFVELLQDHHAATIVGAPTVGAGCGYTNGGIPTVLPNSGARVRMPDCARFRADGSNAVAGVTPDVVLPLLDRDSPYQRAKKVIAGLGSAWGRIVGRTEQRDARR